LFGCESLARGQLQVGQPDLAAAGAAGRARRRGPLRQAFTHYDPDADGLVTTHFTDGSTAIGNLLVGTDGGNPRVRRQYLPHAERIDTGVTGIQGKVWLTDEIRALIPARLPAGP
jgi:2-polyprenyl-6-methoxyphenol hydroxylase-like FAD-dependent oxidoreductase